MHKSWINILVCVILLFVGGILIYCGINKLNQPAVYFISSFIVILSTIVLVIFRNNSC